MVSSNDRDRHPTTHRSMNHHYLFTLFVLLVFALFDLKQCKLILPGPNECGQLKFSPENLDLDTKLREHPWIVGIKYWYPNANRVSIDCSGVLISQRHVIVGGACLRYNGDEIVTAVSLGRWSTKSDVYCVNGNCSEPSIDVAIETFWISYKRADWVTGNIALIKMVYDVTFTEWIQPICFPNTTIHKEIKSYVGAMFVNTGWSRQVLGIDVRQKRSLVIWPDNLCKNKIQLQFDSYTHFCAKSEACYGDIPAMGIDTNDPDNPFWYIFGVISHIDEEDKDLCSAAGLRIGTKIVPYLDWILDKMENY